MLAKCPPHDTQYDSALLQVVGVFLNMKQSPLRKKSHCATQIYYIELCYIPGLSIVNFISDVNGAHLNDAIIMVSQYRELPGLQWEQEFPHGQKWEPFLDKGNFHMWKIL